MSISFNQDTSTQLTYSSFPYTISPNDNYCTSNYANTLSTNNSNYTTNASNNGLCHYRQPDMKGKSPLAEFPRVIEIDIPFQLYADPHDILERALKTMYDDLSAIQKHELKSRAIIKAGNQYSYNDVSIKLEGNDLTCVLVGYIGMIGEVIVSSAYSVSGGTLTHFTSMWVHPTKKETLIRISGDVDAFANGIELAMMRVKKLIEQL